MNLQNQDPKIAELITAEEARQHSQLNLIASENITSEAVREAVGSVLMHKYSEGNIGKRYYEGNEYIDSLEQLCIDRAKELFKLPQEWEVNVQALSGSNANLASILGVLQPGDAILSMYLPDGGHLSHGWSYEPDSEVDPLTKVYLQGSRKVHVVAKLFNVIQYKTDPETNLIDYDSLAEIARIHKPKLIITGGTAYPRDIDYQKVKEIATEVGALYLADIAHEAGLIAAGVLPSPVGVADIVTMTTHKTLRSARGAIILAPAEIIKRINRAVLPGLQGGPFNNNIAGICVGLGEALKPEFKVYAQSVLDTATALASALTEHGFKLVSGGTDKHLILIDLTNKEVTGKVAAGALAKAGIILNMNTIPGEKRAPSDPSGIRLGTPLITTLGAKVADMDQIAGWIDRIVTQPDSEENIAKVAQEVAAYMAGLRKS
jgi:glycine hydroxymethyltransferase